MLPLLSVVLLAAAPDTQLTIAGSELSRVHVDAEVADYALEHLSQRLATEGIHLVTPKEIGTLLGMEKQRQLLGCSEGAGNCMVELGNALGAAGVLVGDLAKFGDTYQLNLRVLDTQTGKPVTTATQQAKNDGDLPRAFDAAATDLIRGLHAWTGQNVAAKSGNASSSSGAGTATDASGATGTTDATAVTAQPAARFSRSVAYVPAAIAAAGVVAAGAGFGYAAYAHSELTASPSAGNHLADDAAQGLADRGSTAQLVGEIGTGVAVAAGATAAALWFMGAPPDAAASTPTVSFAPNAHHGGTLVLSGTFP